MLPDVLRLIWSGVSFRVQINHWVTERRGWPADYQLIRLIKGTTTIAASRFTSCSHSHLIQVQFTHSWGPQRSNPLIDECLIIVQLDPDLQVTNHLPKHTVTSKNLLRNRRTWQRAQTSSHPDQPEHVCQDVINNYLLFPSNHLFSHLQRQKVLIKAQPGCDVNPRTSTCESSYFFKI